MFLQGLLEESNFAHENGRVLMCTDNVLLPSLSFREYVGDCGLHASDIGTEPD